MYVRLIGGMRRSLGEVLSVYGGQRERVMCDVIALVEEARSGLEEGRRMCDLVEDLDAAARWKVDAAYAYTRRRDIDAEFRPVADLFEVAIAWRKRHVLRGPRWWHHFEVIVGLAGVFMLAYIAMPLAPMLEVELGWWFAVRAIIYLAIVGGMFKFGRDLAWLVEDRDQHLTHHAVGIVDELDEVIRDAPDLDVAAERVRRLAVRRPDEVSQWLASFALANAHYRVAALPRRQRRNKMQVISRARTQQLDRTGLSALATR